MKLDGAGWNPVQLPPSGPHSLEAFSKFKQISYTNEKRLCKSQSRLLEGVTQVPCTNCFVENTCNTSRKSTTVQGFARSLQHHVWMRCEIYQHFSAYEGSVNTFECSGFCSKAEEELIDSDSSIVFLGLNLHSVSYRATLSEQRMENLRNCVSQIHLGKTVSFQLCMRLLS